VKPVHLAALAVDDTRDAIHRPLLCLRATIDGEEAFRVGAPGALPLVSLSWEYPKPEPWGDGAAQIILSGHALQQSPRERSLWWPRRHCSPDSTILIEIVDAHPTKAWRTALHDRPLRPPSKAREASLLRRLRLAERALAIGATLPPCLERRRVSIRTDRRTTAVETRGFGLLAIKVQAESRALRVEMSGFSGDEWVAFSPITAAAGRLQLRLGGRGRCASPVRIEDASEEQSLRGIVQRLKSSLRLLRAARRRSGR
jgi:hypothetical protein